MKEFGRMLKRSGYSQKFRYMKSFPTQCKDIRICDKENGTEDNQLTGPETMTKKEDESEKRRKENVGIDENHEAQV